MEEYLEKKLYVFRKSYNFYFKINLIILILKVTFSVSTISCYYYLPLAMFSLFTAIIEIIEKSIKMNERIIEYRLAYKFYNSSLNLYKAKKLTEEEIRLRENDFIENIQFFAREKYIKQTQLNGYNFLSIINE